MSEHVHEELDEASQAIIDKANARIGVIAKGVVGASDPETVTRLTGELVRVLAPELVVNIVPALGSVLRSVATQMGDDMHMMTVAVVALLAMPGGTRH